MTPLPIHSHLASAFAKRSLRTRGAWLGAAVLALSACASAPVPTEQLAVTTAAVAQAVSAGGQELAPTEMSAARDKLVRAHLAVAAKDNEQALRLAQQAQADAQLAGSKAEAMKARRAQTELDEAARVLREEMARKKP
jgi:galactokinase